MPGLEFFWSRTVHRPAPHSERIRFRQAKHLDVAERYPEGVRNASCFRNRSPKMDFGVPFEPFGFQFLVCRKTEGYPKQMQPHSALDFGFPTSQLNLRTQDNPAWAQTQTSPWGGFHA